MYVGPFFRREEEKDRKSRGVFPGIYVVPGGSLLFITGKSMGFRTI